MQKYLQTPQTAIHTQPNADRNNPTANQPLPIEEPPTPPLKKHPPRQHTRPLTDLEHHADKLRGELELLLLPDERLEDALRPHVRLARLQAVHPDVRVRLVHLPRLGLAVVLV